MNLSFGSWNKEVAILKSYRSYEMPQSVEICALI